MLPKDRNPTRDPQGQAPQGGFAAGARRSKEAMMQLFTEAKEAESQIDADALYAAAMEQFEACQKHAADAKSVAISQRLAANNAVLKADGSIAIAKEKIEELNHAVLTTDCALAISKERFELVNRRRAGFIETLHDFLEKGDSSVISWKTADTFTIHNEHALIPMLRDGKFGGGLNSWIEFSTALKDHGFVGLESGMDFTHPSGRFLQGHREFNQILEEEEAKRKISEEVGHPVPKEICTKRRKVGGGDQNSKLAWYEGDVSMSRDFSATQTQMLNQMHEDGLVETNATVQHSGINSDLNFPDFGVNEPE